MAVWFFWIMDKIYIFMQCARDLYCMSFFSRFSPQSCLVEEFQTPVAVLIAMAIQPCMRPRLLAASGSES